MTVPKYFEMHKPFLEFLKDGKPHKLKELKSLMGKYFQLSDTDLNEMQPSGRQTYFANRIGWASTYLKKAGLIVSPAKATFVITDSGRRVLNENVPVIDVNYLMKFPEFRKFQNVEDGSNKSSQVKEINDDETPDDAFEDAFRKINKSLSDDLLSEIMKLTPEAFEKMVLDLMRKMGYGTFENAAHTTAITGDEGIDGIIMEDKLGFDLIYIQAKRWGDDHTVGRPEVQAFVGAIAGKGGKGLFVTTSKFSKQAVDYAKNQHIILLDGEKLTNFMIEHNFGVSTKKVFEIKVIDTDVFNDYKDE